jgi:hypothetical protein
MSSEFNAYRPALIIFLTAIFFLMAPVFMATMIALGLGMISIFYAYVVYKFKKALRFKDIRNMNEFDQGLYESGGPSFRNVTVTVLKRTPFA